MTQFFSAEHFGFFDDQVHHVLPPDAVALAPGERQRLIDLNAQGHPIVVGDDGRPTNRMTRRSSVDKRQELTARAKQEAFRRITLAVPLWRQINDTVAMLGDPTARDDPGIAQRQQLVAALRLACDALEHRIAAADARALANFDPTSDAHWPATN